MTPREICKNHLTFAYSNELGGIELKHIDYGIEDYIYCISNSRSKPKFYHRLKVFYDVEHGAFIKIHNTIYPLKDFIFISRS